MESLASNEDEVKSKKWHVVALSGVSGGGKTTIALKLLNNVPSSIIYIGQDEYILPNDYSGHLKAPEPLSGYNKDSLHSIDMKKMMTDIRYVLMTDPEEIDISNLPLPQNRKEIIGSALASPRPPFHGWKRNSMQKPLLILDGFLLFNHPELPRLCDTKYFFTLTKAQCLERRKKRAFSVLGMDAEAYFELCMWQKYEEHFEEMHSTVKDIQYIDGSNSLEANYQVVWSSVCSSLRINIF